MFYILLFSILSSISLLGEYFFQKKIYLILFALLFVILCLYAGGRGEYVGTDIHFYVLQVFDRNLNCLDFNDFLCSYKLEFFYELTAFLISRLTNDVHYFLFINSFLFLFFIFVGTLYYCNKYSISYSFVFIILLLCYYNYSFNIMRQSISVAIIFASSCFLLEKKYLLYYIGCIFALQFHDSGVTGIGIGLLYTFYNFFKFSKNKRLFFNFILIFVASILLLSIQHFFLFAVEIGLLSQHFVENYYDYATQKTSIVYALIQIPTLFLVILCFFLRKIDNNLRVFMIFPLFLFILAYVNTNYGFANRLLYYFSIFNIIIVPYAIKLLSNNKKLEIIFCLLFVLWCACQWWWSIYICDSGETLNYEWTW